MSDKDNDTQPLLPINNTVKRKSCCRRLCCAFAYILSILIIIVTTVAITLLVQYYLEEQQEPPTPRPKTFEKTVLLWDQPTNQIRSFPTTVFKQNFVCSWSYRPFVVTNDRRLISDAEFVMFTDTFDVAELPTVRPAYQRYLQTRNCYDGYYSNSYMDNFFNDSIYCDASWYTKPTVTHRGRTNSLPYYNVWIEPRPSTKSYVSKLALKKSDTVLLREQPCKDNARLEELISDLRKYITFNSYGVCNETIKVEDVNGDYLGRYTVQLKQNPAPIASYKFVLLFEDEITSNFYEVLRNWAVPVVFTSENVTHYAPPNSFINGNDFKTMRELADHLNNLIQNPSKYLKYFRWHNEYELFDVDYEKLCDTFRYIYNPYNSAGNDLSKVEQPMLRLIFQLTFAFILTMTYRWM